MTHASTLVATADPSASGRPALSRRFGVALVGDARAIGNNALTAAEAIAHHDAVLPMVAPPVLRIATRGGAAVGFEGQQ